MKPGDILEDRFQLESIAGRGGMGEVWRAHDKHTSQPVALKVLLAARSAERARFLREAKALAALNHPGIVRHIAHGLLPSEEPYLVMEWLDGEDLSTRMERSALSLEEGIRVTYNIARALQFVHEKGIIHRDIKPSNIWLTRKDLDAVKLLDFGLVQVSDDLGKLTKTGLFIGTPAYTSPEQAHALHDVDARADLFSLGCVLFECLTGRTPFKGDSSLSLMLKILTEEPPLLRSLRPDAPAALESLISQLLEKEPKHRPNDAAQLIERLSTLKTSQRTPPKKSLTERERQFLCVMLAKEVFSFYRHAAESAAKQPAQKSPVTVVQQAQPENAQQEARFLLRDMQALAEEHGGKIYPIAGGSLAVFFRGGVATDQAQKAGRCALALQQLVPSAQIAIALQRGTERSPIGETIERASALLRDVSANEQGILLDRSSAGLFEMSFEVVTDGERLVLQGAHPLALARKTLLGRPTPYTGRAKELTSLQETMEDAFADKLATVVLVTAEAGMGKSRLLLEFLESLTQAPLILFAQADPIRGGSPFSLLASIIRRRANISDSDARETQQKKIRDMVARCVNQSTPATPNVVRLSGGLSLKPAVTSYPTQVRVAEFLGELCGVRFSEERSGPLKTARQSAHVMGEQMRRALEDWLSAEAHERPVLMVLEDLHVGDMPSISFLDSALYRLRQSPFFILILARPEVHQVFPNFWASHRVFEMPLGALDDEACHRFIVDVLGEQASEEVISLLVSRSRGNPFYLEEFCRAVAQNRSDVIPETILAMTQSRLEHLSPAQRRVLRAASIFGQSFWPSGVARLLGQNNPQEMGQLLIELLQEELIVLHPESKFSHELEYGFQHALWREALYASLTPEDLALGHGLAGEWLLERREHDAWTLAEHFAKSTEPERASVWYGRSAEQSFEGNDLAAALMRAQKAQARGAKDEELGPLLLMQGEVLLWQGRYAESSECFLLAQERLPLGGLRWYKCTAGLVVTSLYRGQYDKLLSLIETLREMEPPPEVSGLYATATSTIVIFSCVAGVYSISTEFLSKLDNLIQQHGSQDPVLHAWTNFSRCYVLNFAEGDAGAFQRAAEEAVVGFAQIGDLRGMSTALTELGRAHAQLGEYDEAEKALRLALEQSERLGIDFVSPIAQQFLASTLFAQGRYNEARELRAAALQGFRAQNNKQMQGLVLIEQAALLLVEGDSTNAVESTEEALPFLEMVPPFRSRSLARLAEVYLAQGQSERAAQVAREAKEVLDSLGGVGYGETLIWLVYVKTLAAMNDPMFASELSKAKQRLQERANQLPKEKREAFLQGVPENAELLSLRHSPA